MGSKVTGELIDSVRSVLGGKSSEMNIIRALHLAKNDVTAAINMLLDIPSFTTRDKSSPLQMTPIPPSPSSSSPYPSSSLKRIPASERAADIEKVRQDGGLAEFQGSPSTSKPLASIGSDWLFVGSMVEPSSGGAGCHAHTLHRSNKERCNRKFIVKGTVEERMEGVEAGKQQMISGAELIKKVEMLA